MELNYFLVLILFKFCRFQESWLWLLHGNKKRKDSLEIFIFLLELGSLHRLSHLCFYSCICCFVVRSTTPLFCFKSLHIRRVTRVGGSWRPTLPFFGNQKKCSGFGKKGPDFVHTEVKFIIQDIVLRVS